MGQTVNLLVYTFGGSNPSSPTKARTETDRAFTLKRQDLPDQGFEVYFGSVQGERARREGVTLR